MVKSNLDRSVGHNTMCRMLIFAFVVFLLLAINMHGSNNQPVLVLKMCTGGCGIGNQMFIYASGLGLALQNPGIPACISGSESSANPLHLQSILRFHVELNVSAVKPFKMCSRHTTGEAGYFWWWVLGQKVTSSLGIIDLFQPPHTVYEPFHFKGGKTTVIDGNLESYKYFQSVPHPIFRLKQHRAAQKWMLQRGLTSVVHVRRGDKVLEGLPVAPISFYENAFRLLGSNRVAVCTDDAQWVLSQTVFQNASVSINHSAGFDMALLAEATDTVIIGIGTFGWWGAYLSKARRKLFYPFQFQGESAAGYRELDFIPYDVPGQGEWIPLYV